MLNISWRMTFAIWLSWALVVWGVFTYIHIPPETAYDRWWAQRHTLVGQCESVKALDQHFCFDRSRWRGMDVAADQAMYFHVTGAFVPSVYKNWHRKFRKGLTMNWQQAYPGTQLVAENPTLTRLIQDLRNVELYYQQDFTLRSDFSSPEQVLQDLSRHFPVQQTAHFQHIHVPYSAVSWRISPTQNVHQYVLYDGQVLITVMYFFTNNQGSVTFSSPEPGFSGHFSIFDDLAIYNQKPDLMEIYQIVTEFLDFLGQSRVAQTGDHT